MAQAIIDDITHQPGAKPVEFGLNGKLYTIDLGQDSLRELEQALEKFIAVATPLNGSTKPSTNGKTRPTVVKTGKTWTIDINGQEFDIDARQKDMVEKWSKKVGAKTVKQLYSEHGLGELPAMGRIPLNKLVEVYDAVHPEKRIAPQRGTVTEIRSVQSPADNQAIRDWAKKKGKTVSDKGRIPADIVEQFHEEHNYDPFKLPQ